MALEIASDAKIQYPSACNAMETLLVHKDVAAAFFPKYAGTTLCVCMYVCVCARVCVCLSMYIRVHAYTHKCIRNHFKYAHACVCAYLYIHVYIRMNSRAR